MKPNAFSNQPRPGSMAVVLSRNLLWHLTAALFVLLSLGVQAQPSANSLVYLAGSDNPQLNQHMTALLQNALGDNTVIRPFRNGQPSLERRTPVITLGAEAFTRVRQENRNVPILALLVEMSFIDGYADRSDGHISGIPYDPPLLRQALTGKAILPHATRVAMLARPETVELYEKVLDQLPRYGMEGKVFVVSSDDRLISTLTRALSYGDFLLAAPDSSIYNPRTIKHILLTAYRRNRIVIGPSQAYVKAGALASSYIPFREIALQAADYINAYHAEGEFPPPSYPDTYRVEVNRQVARSLNILLPSREEIAETVTQRLSEAREESDE